MGAHGGVSLTDWGISYTTLEDVFMRLAKGADEGKAHNRISMKIRLPVGSYKPGQPFDVPFAAETREGGVHISKCVGPGIATGVQRCACVPGTGTRISEGDQRIQGGFKAGLARLGLLPHLLPVVARSRHSSRLPSRKLLLHAACQLSVCSLLLKQVLLLLFFETCCFRFLCSLPRLCSVPRLRSQPRVLFLPCLHLPALPCRLRPSNSLLSRRCCCPNAKRGVCTLTWPWRRGRPG